MASNTSVYDMLVGEDPSAYQRDYDPALAVESFHTLPRFSHKGDISLLFSDDPDEVRDYAFGLLFVALLIISFFSVWGFILLLFKTLGQKRVGFLSGHSFTHVNWKSTTARSIYLISNLIVFVFSILVVTKGITSLDNTTDTIDAVNQDVIKIHNELTTITTNLRTVAREATPVRDELVSFFENDTCPLKPGSIIEQQVLSLGEDALDAMKELDTFMENELVSVQGALAETQIATQDVADAVEGTQFTGPKTAAILIPLLIIPTFLLVALFMGWCEVYYEWYYCFITWFILPLFVVMVMFTFFASAFGALGTEGNADFCSGGVSNTPEETVHMILSEYGQTDDSFYYNAVTFYSNQCKSGVNPFEFMQDYYVQLSAAKASMDEFAQVIVNSSVEQLSQECGADYGPVLQLLNQLRTYSSILLDSSDRSMQLMSCQNIVPLYTTVVYDGVCSTSIRGGTWIFAGFFVISFFGMIMIMLRGSYYPIEFFGEDDDDEKDDVSTGSSEEEDADYTADGNSGGDQETATGSEYYGNNDGANGRRRARMLDKITKDAGSEVEEVASVDDSQQNSNVFFDDAGESQYTENQSARR